MFARPKNIPNVTTLDPKGDCLRVIPLGGIGEIGMNCNLFEFNGEMLMIDCGQMMPDEEMLGVDYVIPDISYITTDPDRLAAIVLTHAHEDHVGALPYILPHLRDDIPVYGSELTIALLREKLKEHKLEPNFKVFQARARFEVGENFMVEPLAVTHSIIDAFAIAVTTPIGSFIHSGDYKMDPAPTDGISFDFHAFSRYAEGDAEGVLLLLGDSTNADRPGVCTSESQVIPTLERLIREATGQIILSTFSSSLHRIQTVLQLAAAAGRTVFPAGLNMERNIRIAHDIHAIDIPCKYERELGRLKDYRPEERLILTTGSQGEPMSGLSRMAFDSHKHVKIHEGDTVILSARLIPGNEKSIYRLINHITRRGAKVFYPGNTVNVHTSGHAYQDEMRHLINLVNPKFLIPLHGEYRHLYAHAQLAYSTGMMEDEICLLENGDCLEVTHDEAKIVGKVPHGRIFVDGKGIGDVEEVVIRDRKYLADDGVVAVIISVSRESGEVLGGPYLSSRGFVADQDAEALLDEAAEVVLEAYKALDPEEKEESSTVQVALRKALRSFLKKKTRRFPVIVPVVMEI